jgi:hypothetical protein
MRMLLILPFFLMAYNLNAMDDESSEEIVVSSSSDESDSDSDDTESTSESSNNKAPKNIDMVKKPVAGVTVEEAATFLYDNQAYTHYSPSNVACALWSATGIGFILSGIPGITVSSLYCRNHQGILDCQNQCPGPKYDKCYYSCESQNDIQSLEHPVCKTGLVLVFVPVAQMVIAACASPISRALNIYVDDHNQQLDSDIRQQFTMARTASEPISQADVRRIAHHLIRANSNLLGKLSPIQALAIAEVNRREFEQLANDGFSEQAAIMAHKLILFHQENSNDLADMLEREEVKSTLQDEPYLWQALVRTLPDVTLNSTKVRAGLRAALIHMQTSKIKQKRQYWDDAITKIAQGTSVYDYILEEISVSHSGDDIAIKTQYKTFVAKKQRLTSISAYFKKTYRASWPEEEIDLSHLNSIWLDVLIKVHDQEPISIDIGNIWDVLSCARHFGIAKLSAQADQLILTQGLLDTLVKKFILEQDDKTLKPKSFKARINFCQTYQQSANQHLLISELLIKLNDITMDNQYLLDDLRLLQDQDIEKANHSFKPHDFSEKLINPSFLAWAWLNAKDITFLREIIVSFCALEKNNSIVAKAWVGLPKDLKQAIEKL